MQNKKSDLINELKSPLQRIMWIYNVDDPARRSFENNICAFHVGNGYFLTVAHNLRMQTGFYKSIDEALYLKEILPKLDGAQKNFMEQCYFRDDYSKKWYLNNHDPVHLDHIAKILKQKRFDTRWVAYGKKGICTPHLVFQFKGNSFFNDLDVTRLFDSRKMMYDNEARKHNFLIEVQLVHAFYGADIALYKIVNTPDEIIAKIPALKIDFDLYFDDEKAMYCLQSSPTSFAGRLLNQAKVEGILDHFSPFFDDVEGNYIFEGNRYLVKGYFRFGSSGAPYLVYDEYQGEYVVNAIQSEASGIQFSIKNDRDGNIQYTHAIATPLNIVKDDLEKLLRGEALIQVTL